MVGSENIFFLRTSNNTTLIKILLHYGATLKLTPFSESDHKTIYEVESKSKKVSN